jgi:hypothetical protein
MADALPDAPPDTGPALAMAGVSYRYPGSDSGVSDVTLTVPRGTI